MFKWIFILILVFLGIWLLQKEILPLQLRQSNYGKSLDSVLFGLDYRINKTTARAKKFNSSIVQIDDARFQSLMRSAHASNKQAIIFLYDTNCYFCRYVLYDINELARQYGKNVLFLVVAFDDNKDRLNYLLSGFSQLYFRPIMVPSVSIKSASYILAKNNIGISETPALIYKDVTSVEYKNLTPDFSAKKQIVEKITRKE